jgi:hypothetical protein
VGVYYAKGLSIEAREERFLLEASFEPVEDDGMLWEKEGVWYGREAALQKASRKLQERDDLYLFDRS